MILRRARKCWISCGPWGDPPAGLGAAATGRMLRARQRRRSLGRSPALSELPAEDPNGLGVRRIAGVLAPQLLVDAERLGELALRVIVDGLALERLLACGGRRLR